MIILYEPRAIERSKIKILKVGRKLTEFVDLVMEIVRSRGTKWHAAIVYGTRSRKGSLLRLKRAESLVIGSIMIPALVTVYPTWIEGISLEICK